VKPIYTKNRTIGLLGGSFNPAHSGHLAITLYALKKLGLDQVWWLVSPKNPLKSVDTLASYEERLRSARDMAAHDHRIIVSDIEAEWATKYSYQTIGRLIKKYPGTRFVWLMGADNLEHFHRWRCWQKITQMLPIIVFDRVPYSHTALRSKAALQSRRFLMKNMKIRHMKCPPALQFVHLKRAPESSSELRKRLGKGAFLRHNKGAG
jgi:nicotinate-nucleotide adenylyltransferase